MFGERKRIFAAHCTLHKGGRSDSSGAGVLSAEDVGTEGADVELDKAVESADAGMELEGVVVSAADVAFGVSVSTNVELPLAPAGVELEGEGVLTPGVVPSQ